MSRVLEFGRAAIRLALLNEDVEKQLSAFETRFEKFGKKLTSLGKSFSLVGGAIVAPFAAGLTAFTSFGGSLNRLSKRTGISVESLQGLGFAAEQSGTSLESFGEGMQGMSLLLLMAARGNKKATTTLKELGVSLEELQGLSPEQKFMRMADAVANVQDPLKRAALAQKVFSGAGYDMIGMLSKGSTGIQELMKQSAAFGPELSQKDADAASLFNRSLKGLWESTKRLSMELGAAVVGPMTNFLQIVRPLVVWVAELAKQHQTLLTFIAAIGATLMGVGTVLLATGTIVLFVSKAINVCKLAVMGVTWAVKALTTATWFLVENPLVALIAVLAAVIIYVLYATGVLGKLFHWIGKIVGITDDATDSTNEFNDALKNLKAPEVDLEALKASMNANIDGTAKSGMDGAKQAQSMFDVSLARQTLGDGNVQLQQLEELRRVNKNLERPRGLTVI